MAPFQGAGAGQAIEVSVCIISVQCERDLRYDLGCFDTGFAALKRARDMKSEFVNLDELTEGTVQKRGEEDKENVNSQVDLSTPVVEVRRSPGTLNLHSVIPLF